MRCKAEAWKPELNACRRACTASECFRACYSQRSIAVECPARQQHFLVAHPPSPSSSSSSPFFRLSESWLNASIDFLLAASPPPRPLCICLCLSPPSSSFSPLLHVSLALARGGGIATLFFSAHITLEARGLCRFAMQGKLPHHVNTASHRLLRLYARGTPHHGRRRR